MSTTVIAFTSSAKEAKTLKTVVKSICPSCSFSAFPDYATFQDACPECSKPDLYIQSASVSEEKSIVSKQHGQQIPVLIYKDTVSVGDVDLMEIWDYFYLSWPPERIRQVIRSAIKHVKAIKDKDHTISLLENGNDHYRNIFLHNRLPILMINPESLEITDANIAASVFYGWPISELSGKLITELNGMSKEDTLEEMQHVINNISLLSGGTHVIADGTMRKVQLYHNSIDLDGTSLIRSIVIHNVTSEDHATYLKNEELTRLKTAALDAVAQATIITNKKGAIIWVNPAFCRLTGYSFEEVVGQNPRILKSGKHTLNFYVDLWDTITSGEVWHGEMHNKRKDGSLFYENSTITPVKAPNGEVTHFIGVKQDITARKHSEAVLEWEATVTAALSTLYMPMMDKTTSISEIATNVLDISRELTNSLDGIIVRHDLLLATNNILASTYSNTGKLSEDEATGVIERKNSTIISLSNIVNEITPSYYNEREGTNLYLALFDGSTYRINNCLIMPILTNNDYLGCIILTNCIFHYDDNIRMAMQRIAEYYGIALQEKHVLSALSESEEKFRGVFERSLDAIFIYSGGYFELVNRSFLDIVGLSPDDVAFGDYQWSNMVVKEDIPSLAAAMDNLLQNESTAKIHDIEIVNRLGNTIKLQVSITSIEYKRKEAVLGVLRDVTDLRSLESQLLQAHKLESIGQLAAGIAHEINTPVQYINDNTLFLKKVFLTFQPLLETFVKLFDVHESHVRDQLYDELITVTDKDKLVYMLEDIPSALDESLEGLDRVTNIVRAMKEFSHPGTQERVLLNLNDAISSTITVARNEWKYVSEVSTELDPQLPLVPGYVAELNQVFVNIIVNAAHAIEEKIKMSEMKQGLIKIRTYSDAENVYITFEDDGIGMAEDVVNRIYDPFFTTKDVGKGTGQGMTIAYNVIVMKHKGNISVSSEPNVGTTFVISLPLDDTNGFSE